VAALTVSVVIPTRNRPSSLKRLLAALAAQERLPDEVIVSDASDEPLNGAALTAAYPALAISCFHMAPALCAQRNRAIARAAGSHILLCDDDIEPGPSYLRRLIEYLEGHAEAGAVSGRVCHPDAVASAGGGFPAPSFRHLLYDFVFQLGLGGNVGGVTAPRLLAPILKSMQRWYERRGNTWTLAGWPLVTQVRHPVVLASVGVLGAALVRRTWLLNSPYDERLDRLDPHAVGDNYGVALGFPGTETIAVLTDLPVGHRQAPENRLPRSTVHYQRILALHYFMRRSGRFSTWNTAWLVWSLAGYAGRFLRAGQHDLFRATVAALAGIIQNRNPLLGRALDSSSASPGPPVT
jgi:glycosyltransferase involved in cell wall biosynthesis